MYKIKLRNITQGTLLERKWVVHENYECKINHKLYQIGKGVKIEKENISEHSVDHHLINENININK